MGDLYGIKTYQLWPQDGPFWWPDRVTGEPELFAEHDDAVRRAYDLMEREDLRGYSFSAARYKDGFPGKKGQGN